MRRTLVILILINLSINGGCSSLDEAPCASDRDCPEGACSAGRCRLPTDGARPADPKPDAEPSPPDAGRPPDADPDAAESVDAAPDGGEPCDRDPPRLARCDAFTLRDETCVDGVWRRGPCRAVPPVPCGTVCEGCLDDRPAGLDTQRIAVRVPEGPIGFDDRHLGGFVTEVCDGCNGFTEGLVDRLKAREIQGGRIIREDCDGCTGRAGSFDGVIDQTELWIWQDDGYRVERRAPPDAAPAIDHHILAADGRTVRIESNLVDGRPSKVTRFTYGPTGLWTGLEVTDADGLQLSRSVVRRDASGAVEALDRYRDGIDPAATYTFDLGCWQCEGDRCALGAPAGCTHLAGAVPPLYLCEQSCPAPLAPAWLTDLFEARFAARRIGDGALDFAVGARRDGERFVWLHSDRAVDTLLYDAPEGAGECAAIHVDADDGIVLRAAPCDGSPVMCRAPETAAPEAEN